MSILGYSLFRNQFINWMISFNVPIDKNISKVTINCEEVDIRYASPQYPNEHEFKDIISECDDIFQFIEDEPIEVNSIDCQLEYSSNSSRTNSEVKSFNQHRESEPEIKLLEPIIEDMIFIKWPEWHLSSNFTLYSAFKYSPGPKTVDKTIYNIINYFDETCIEMKLSSLVITRAVQIFLRRLSKGNISWGIILYMSLCCLKVSIQLEYDQSEFEKLTEVSIMVSLRHSKLIEAEGDLLSSLSCDFYRDTIYENLSIKERIMVETTHKKIYYNFVKDVNNYFMITSDATNLFRSQFLYS